MVTPVYTGRSDLQILWVLIHRVPLYRQFHAMGDHGVYCPIAFGGE